MRFDHLLPFVDGLKASVFVVDGDRHILLVNDAGRALFGEGLVGVDFVQAVRNPKCLKAIGKVLEGKKKAETVITLQNPVPMTFRQGLLSALKMFPIFIRPNRCAVLLWPMSVMNCARL